MLLKFLGSGSAFTIGADNYHSNMLLENNQQNRLLIDCGSDARLSLYELGYTYKDIDNLYISHLHADHVGGMEWLSFTRYFDKDCTKPNLFVPSVLIRDLWERVLSGGLSSVEMADPCIDTFFNVKPIKKNSSFSWSNTKFYIVKTIHICSDSGVIPSYGLFFNVDNLNVFITTDTQFFPDQIMQYYLKADIIFHDCETSEALSGVHSHFTELVTLEPSIKSKMWLYHYNPGPLPDPKKDGFRGFVKKGQTFDFTDETTLF